MTPAPLPPLGLLSTFVRMFLPIAASFLIAATPPDVETEVEAPKPVLPLRFTISVGFQHWYGGTFGAPIGLYTPGLTLGVAPTRWLELQLQYSISVVALAMPDGSKSRVGFATLAVLMKKEFGFDGQRVTFACGPQGGIVHTRRGVREAMGAAIVSRYLINTRDTFALGPFIDMRAMLYELPESTTPIYRIEKGELIAGLSDAQGQIGVVVSF